MTEPRKPDKPRRSEPTSARRVSIPVEHVTPESKAHRYHSEDAESGGFVDLNRYTLDHEDCA